MPVPLIITGSSGFVGRTLAARLDAMQWGDVRLLSRAEYPQLPADGTVPGAQWQRLFLNAAGAPPVLIHLAARAHVLDDRASNPLEQFRAANVTYACRLAELAFEQGVQRFVFVSSIGAVGDCSKPGLPLAETHLCAPNSLYGVSKLEAERALQSIADRYGRELVIIRPPLVYGPGAPGNLAKMAGIVARGIPLPLASIDNRRSLLHVENLCDALIACATHPSAPGHVFHVRDHVDYSTPQILRMSAEALGVNARLFSVPIKLLELAARTFGQHSYFDRLCSSLQVDDTQIRSKLGFVPKKLPFQL